MRFPAVRPLVVILLLGLVAPAAAPAADKVNASAAATAASEQRLREDVTYLAADELEGRGVGTEGLNKAAEYLAAEFARLGLKTDLFDGTPFQKFSVNVAVEMGPAEQNRLALSGPPAAGGKPQGSSLKLGESFNPLAAGSSGSFDAPLVFVGYGITAELKKDGVDFKYDDYADLDVKGKVAIVLRKEPQQQDAKSPFNGVRTTPHALFQRKLANAADHGAAAVIFVNDGLELEMRRADSRKILGELIDKLAKLGADFASLPADKQAEAAKEIRQAAEQAAELNKRLAGSTDALLPFDGAGGETQGKLPALFATRAEIDAVLLAALGKDLATIERAIDADLAPRSAELTGWRAVGETNVIQKTADVKNVIAVLEGQGPLADETIVIGAHYDHLGNGGAGSLAPWTSAIHNGADDNASGTATLLEVAHRLATAGQKPQRRIVFIAFTGEERGLLGSAHYVRNPRFALENTVAMFNLDMVGRLQDDKLIVYGTGTAKEFDPLVESLGQKYSFKLSKQPEGYGPSDHSSFYGKKIPVLHLFTGTHSDYHRPSDDSPKLNIEGMRRVADFVVDVLLATDARTERPRYVEIKKVATIAPSNGEASDRPYFGSMPAYPNPEKDGVLLERIAENSPAAKAGLKDGDVLLSVGGHRTVSLEDFQAALSGFKPGDKVKIKVRRGQETVEGETVLTRRGMP
jgi:hypothetical protein